MDHSQESLLCEPLDLGSPIDWAQELILRPGTTLLYSGSSELGEYCEWDMIALQPSETLIYEPEEVLHSENEILLKLQEFMEAPWMNDQNEAISLHEWFSLSQRLGSALPMAHCMLSYELGAQARGISPRASQHASPALWAARYNAIYLFLRAEGRAWLISSSKIALDHLKSQLINAYQSAQFRLNQNEAYPSLNANNQRVNCEDQKSSEKNQHLFTPMVNFETYHQCFEALRESILSGDVYQMNLTLPLTYQREDRESALILFQRLCSVNAGQFSGFIQIDDRRSILSLSPERLVRWSGLLGERTEPSKRYIETAPIKGTRPRRKDPIQDEAERLGLLKSEKDAAEHVMILDLERNDLGRICESGSVRVVVNREARRYATVHHLVSVVRGELSRDIQLVDILKAIFPGGSITGAPKLRSMELIRSLEPFPRGIYCGALGYLDPLGGGDLNLPIRTLFCNLDQLIYHAGGGIVADSSVDHEWDELWVKTQGVERAFSKCHTSSKNQQTSNQ